MFMPCHQITGQNHYIKVTENLENAENFKHVGIVRIVCEKLRGD
jgi:hypothetical protein